MSDATLQIKLTAYALGELPEHEAATIAALLRIDAHARAMLIDVQESIAGAEIALSIVDGMQDEQADDPDEAAEQLIVDPQDEADLPHPAPLQLAGRCKLAIETEIHVIEHGPRQARLEANRRRRIDAEPYAWLPAGAAAAVLIAFSVTLAGLPGDPTNGLTGDSKATHAHARAMLPQSQQPDPSNEPTAATFADAGSPSGSIEPRFVAASEPAPAWSRPINWPDRPDRVQFAQSFGSGWHGQSHR